MPDASSISFSAPGSLMISGEHAVLHGYHALAGAVDRRIRVSLTPRKSDKIEIISALGNRCMPLTKIDASPPLQFIGSTLQRYSRNFKNGFTLKIEAEFSATVGLGSSAAITAACLAAVATHCNGKTPDKNQLLNETVQIIREVQGRGSGSDAAASIYGGIILYKATPQVLARYTTLPPICLIYAGYKTPTTQVIEFVENQRANTKDKFKALFDRIDVCTMFANSALNDNNWNALGNALNRGQLMMEMLGVCDQHLQNIIDSLTAHEQISGAKISGSGLGDCVIGIGSFSPPADWPYEIIPVQLSARGLEQES